MKKLLILLLPLVLAGCYKDTLHRTDEENRIIELAYDENYRYPEGFWHETITEGSVYYENTISTVPVEERKDRWIELSTDDYEEAKQWSDKSAEYSSVERILVSVRETEKYFEFKRQSKINERDIILSRVHKSGYFIPQFDKFLPLDTLGVFHGNLTKKGAQVFIEYLWSSGSIGFVNSKVIQSEITETGEGFVQYIKSFNLIHGDFDLKDVIQVYQYYFTLNKQSGLLTIKSKQVDSFEVEW